MHANSRLMKLWDLMPLAESTQVVSALRQDALAWDGLARGDLLERALQTIPAARCWTPARLALLAAGVPFPAENAPVAPPPGILEMALQSYDLLLTAGQFPSSSGELAGAGLAALALHERFRRMADWVIVLREPVDQLASLSTQGLARWRCVIACLYSLAGEPAELLQAFAALGDPAGMDWACHCVLTTPQGVEDQGQALLRVLRGLPLERQVTWLQHVRAQGRGRLAALAAAALCSAAEEDALTTQPVQFERIPALRARAALRELAGNASTAAKLLRVARDGLLHSVAEVQVQHAGLANEPVRWPEVSTRALVTQAVQSPQVLQDLILGAGKNAQSENVIDLLGDGDQPALALLAQAQAAAAAGDLTTARELARKSVPLFLQDCSEKHPPYSQSVFAWDAVQTLRQFSWLGLTAEACQVAAAALACRPGELALVRAATALFQANGEPERALEWAGLELALDPLDLAARRSFARLNEAVGDWDQALAGWEAVLMLQVTPAVSDRLGVARCAFHCQQSERTLEVCEAVLAADPEEGLAHALVGEVARQRGQREDAMRHLSRATLLSPEEPRPWLSLAGIYREDGETQRELETLQAAVLAVPDDGDLHFALAKAHLDLDAPSDALPHLQKAAQYNAHSPEAAWMLGKTLFQLGHVQQARRVLEAARVRWPQHPLVAVADAETLMEAGELDAAIQPLEVAVNSLEPQPEWFRLYARALLRYQPDKMIGETGPVAGTRLEQAETALRTLIEACPENFEAGVMLAETLFAQGSLNAAFGVYSALVEKSEAALPEWRWRVQAGFGKTALQNHAVEIAIAALREATQAQPENIGLQQLLSRAFQEAALVDEAAQAARQALQLAPDDFQNLAWYIEAMKMLGKESETVNALTAVTQQAPERADFWNLLAQVQTDKADYPAARAALAGLVGLPQLTQLDLQTAAGTYARLGEYPAALECINRAVNGADAAPSELLVERAALQHRLGDPRAALGSMETALASSPEELPLHVFQADLLAETQQHQSALAALERAVRLLECQPETRATAKFAPASLPEDWWLSLSDPVAIYIRFALLLRAAGALAAALTHAEKALDLQPANRGLRFLAADLALGMLDRARAEQILAAEEASTAVSEDPWAMALAGLRAEMALETGHDEQAQKIASASLADSPNHSRFLALRARLALRAGNWADAQSLYAAALDTFAISPVDSLRQLDYVALFDGSRLELAETALDLEQWGEALKAIEAHCAARAQEARAHLRYARALVICAERQHLCAALRSTTHAPGADALSAQAFERFERAIQAAGRLVSSGEISIWQARGRAAFQPGLQNAPAVAKLPNPAEHAPALLSTLRLAKNAENAIRITAHYPQTPALQLELALCYLDRDNYKGLAAARKAVDAQPDRALYHAAQALLAEAAGETHEAVLSLQTALTLWPDEPGWQNWAAKLCHQTGDCRAAQAHYEQSLSLDPAQTDTALALGRLYLDSGQGSSAVTTLERACMLNHNHVEAYMLLAQARRMTGDLAGALENTETAARLAPDQAAPRLLSGEIALQMGKHTTAIQHARAALACKADDPAAVLFLSRVLVQTGALSDGLSVLEKAATHLGNVPAVMIERANLIRRLYGPQVALSVFVELGQKFPQDAQVLSLLAQAQADCGDIKSAERSAFAAHHINPDVPQLNLLLGRLQRSSGQLDQAIHFFSEAIRQSPGEIEAYLDLGEAYLDRREHIQALRTYQQAIKVAPRDFRPFYQAAGVLRESKDYIGAETMLRRAAELAPGDLNIRRQLGAVVALNLVHNSQEANAAL